MRALSGDASIQIRDWHLYHHSSALDSIAPHLHLDNLKASWTHPRGVLDGIALRVRYSNAQLHASLTPEGTIESLIFEVLEQIRVESNCPEEFKGSLDAAIYQHRGSRRQYGPPPYHHLFNSVDET